MLIDENFPQSDLRQAITGAYHEDETQVVERLLQQAALNPDQLSRVALQAKTLVEVVRKTRKRPGGIDDLMARYHLSSQEGIALMCLAEAMLRIPDQGTIDQLISDKLSSADWRDKGAQKDSWFADATTWGLMVTGKLLAKPEVPQRQLKTTLQHLLKQTGMPVIRAMVGQAMKILGQQFVMGRNIKEALKRATLSEKKGYRFSYDMLGEAARTEADAERYFQAYLAAIESIGLASVGKTPIEAPGISVKLSALHPRYEQAQYASVMAQLTPRLKALAMKAREHDIGLTVDAEEADRLMLSLDVIEAVFCDPDLGDWQGFGLAVQAYQKRAMALIDWLADLAKSQKKQMMIRLIKGAYWDSEIKHAQTMGFDDYPVFTRKCATDVSYIACAKKILDYGDCFYPQFATHNALSVATVLELVGDRRDFEFQALHGMGSGLYDHIVGDDNLNIPCRTYAPVGSHEDLLPYLVRRLLENGANSSFVNRLSDDKLPIETIITNPIARLAKLEPKPHPKIPKPYDLYQPERPNSVGIDLTDRDTLEDLKHNLTPLFETTWQGGPVINGELRTGKGTPVLSPTDRRVCVGQMVLSTVDQVEEALQGAVSAVGAWMLTPVAERAACLRRMAVFLEARQESLIALLIREAGKTLPDTISEVREAVDFCYYYAMQAEKQCQPIVLPGPTGEENTLSLHGRGVMLCISPWNFPVAIFLGQITAALVTGNAVISKPAEQTSLVATLLIQWLHEAGVPKSIVHCVPGEGKTIGAALVADQRISGVMFTGSTETATVIQQTLATRGGPIVPFIAETGGQNAMLVDSSALPEQVVLDVVQSAFGSAGQRCSALRVLFVQSDVADNFIKMLKGAMALLTVGDPQWLATDVGPVIDETASKVLQAHLDHLKETATFIASAGLSGEAEYGYFIPPSAYEIKKLSDLKREVFGPVLHVIRYNSNKLDDVINDINATGYGLTFGIHSRIDSMIKYVSSRVRVGNVYVNRNIIGAVVGVQPFGGEGLSGTGPKAGGPHYLARLCVEKTVSTNTAAAGGNASLLSL